ARGSVLRDDRHHGYVPEVTPIIMDRRLNAIGVRETVRVLHLRTACATVRGRRCHAMHVGVIGGTGHISTSLVRVLLAQGHAVTCINRGLRCANAPGARLVRGDRRGRAAFERTRQAERCDAVIDMRCFTRADARSSLHAYRNVSHVVQCSTVCTYGITSDGLPVTEDHPLRPLTPYGQHKAADATVLEASAHDGFRVTILKPSTTYGPIQG